MKSFRIITSIGVLLLLSVWSAATGIINIVPHPLEIKQGKGYFIVQPTTRIIIDPGNSEIRKIADLIVHKIINAGGPALTIIDKETGGKARNSIILSLQDADTALGIEGYTLNISKNKVQIRAVAGNGLFYGVQSFFQLFPPEIERKSERNSTYKLPVVFIKDKPRYSYRGMHLDVCRHFFPVSFIKEYIDLMAMYKMNTFHWHLTDDQGWRIQIKKYPRLTQVGSTRTGTVIGKTSENDGIPYGGFYTRDQIKDIVAYASEKYVNIIPEIEMPGHSMAALTAYPNLSCTGGPFQVRTEWGISDDILCAGNDSAYIFVKDVLDEIIELFPSKYIHIGGDEAPKIRWKDCPKCQARIKEQGLRNESELQSYFIRQVERFLHSRDRKLIGWDEILEGGLAPDATVMSWRGIQGGIDAARQDHDVIMTPGEYCYLDKYQANPATEPLAIGGYLTLKTVYSYEPTPEELTAEQGTHILGVQGNVWTEYLATPQIVEYMAYPRALAISEIAWSTKESKSWENFSIRMDDQYKRLGYKGINYSKGSFEVDITTKRDTDRNLNLVELSSEINGTDIYYTLDGSAPDASSAKYTKPFPVKATCLVKACLVKDGIVRGNSSECKIVCSLASGKPVKIIKPFSNKYPGTGDNAMTDGLLGTVSFHSGWQGYEGTDMEIVIDLLQPELIKKIGTTFIQDPGSWVLFPVDVTFYTSSDGLSWEQAGNIQTPPLPAKGKADREFSATFPQKSARFIKLTAKNIGVLPEWHEYKGEPSWIFADEIIVE